MKDDKKRFFDIKIQLNNYLGADQNQVAREITNILNKNNIFADSIKIKNESTYDKNPKLTLKNIYEQFSLSKDELLESHDINWDMMSKHVDMSEGFMKYAWDNLNLDWVIYRILTGKLNVTNKFKKEIWREIESFKNGYNWDDMKNKSYKEIENIIDDTTVDSCNSKSDTLPNSGVYDNNIQSINDMAKNNIKYNPMMPTNGDYLENLKNILSERFNVNKDDITIMPVGSPIPYGQGEYGIIPPEYIQQDVYDPDNNKLLNTYITLDNYKELLPPIDSLDKNMWKWISINCKMSPEFVDKFTKKIHLPELISKNPYFINLMRCDWFFDKYIEDIKEMKDYISRRINNRLVKVANFRIPDNER